MTPEVAIALAGLILKGGADIAALIGRILSDTGKTAEEKEAALVEALAELRAKDAAVQAT
jgi:hypothetical protein